MRVLLLATAILLISNGTSRAVIVTFLNDDVDDLALVRKVADKKDVVEFRKTTHEFAKKLYPLKEKDFIALFGESQEKPEKTYAMPVAQARVLGRSGLRYSDPKRNKDHTEFYAIKDVAALEVWYQIDGETPAAILLYFPTDKNFPKLTKDNLAQRLAWDDDRFKKLVAFYEKRILEAFPWEIDQKELAKINQGDFSLDAKTRLEAWIESGKKLGYKYEHEEGSKKWYWYRDDKCLARSAEGSSGDGPPFRFVWYQGRSSKFREEHLNPETGTFAYRRWRRPEVTNIRSETPADWTWFGKDNNVVRHEWDDNGDGIPDWYVTAKDGLNLGYDPDIADKRRLLNLEESWAINPKLIPEENRISDQPDLRVPIRRKLGVMGEKK